MVQSGNYRAKTKSVECRDPRACRSGIQKTGRRAATSVYFPQHRAVRVSSREWLTLVACLELREGNGVGLMGRSACSFTTQELQWKRDDP